MMSLTYFTHTSALISKIHLSYGIPSTDKQPEDAIVSVS